MMKIAAAIVTLCLFVSGCTTPASQAVAPATLDQQAKSFVLRSDAGTVYLYQGIQKRMPTLWQSAEAPLVQPADYFVNGQLIGGLNHNQYFALSLPPGEYQFTWKGRWDGATMSAPFNLSVAAGSRHFLRSIFDSAGSEMLGLLGGLTFRYYLEPAPGTGQQDVAARTLVQSNVFMFAGSGATSFHPPSANPASPSTTSTRATEPIADRLAKLKMLYDRKLISEQEYLEKRRQILDGL